MESNYIKAAIALKYYMLGAKMHNAVRAMEFARQYHVGTRKGGEPEFIHQIGIANFLRTLNLPDGMEEIILCIAFLHDTVEDYPVSIAVIREKFGNDVANGVAAVSKVIDGAKLPLDKYFENVGSNVHAALVKGADRINNQDSMVGVFTIAKQKEYVRETETYILPALKKAREANPEVEKAFENIKYLLESQIKMLKAIHVALNQ